MGQIPSHPVLTLDGAKRFEAELFGGDEAKEWPAMQRAGSAVGRGVLRDFAEIGPFPHEARLLVLVGKGHNGGDALLAAQTVLERHASARADVWLLFGERALRPLAARAYRELVQSAPGRVNGVARPEQLASAYDISLDGVFGFQFRPPLTPEIAATFSKLNAWPVRFRAAVDLPSGVGEARALRADFTYATGSVKTPAVDDTQRGVVGRLRYLDLGFFEVTGKGGADAPSSAVDDAEHRPHQNTTGDSVLSSAVLAPLRELRPAACDKRTYGHLFIVGGSRSYPGAVLMSALAAVHSGAGLVTAFVPESLAAAFAARLPEVIWVGWPEAPGGGLALEGSHLLRERLDRAGALLLGPGVGCEPETLALMKDVVKTATVPLVIDADALQPEIVRAGSAPRVLTPHAGEFARIAGGAGLADFPKGARAITVLKGPLTRIGAGGVVYHSCFGGPVLARGGSGDVLAGMVGGLLAQEPSNALLAACRGVVWHGLAADRLARTEGQIAVRATQLVEHLGAVLRETHDAG